MQEELGGTPKLPDISMIWYTARKRGCLARSQQADRNTVRMLCRRAEGRKVCCAGRAGRDTKGA